MKRYSFRSTTPLLYYRILCYVLLPILLGINAISYASFYFTGGIKLLSFPLLTIAATCGLLALIFLADYHLLKWNWVGVRFFLLYFILTWLLGIVNETWNAVGLTAVYGVFVAASYAYFKKRRLLFRPYYTILQESFDGAVHNTKNL